MSMTADLHDLLARLQRLEVSLWDDDGHLGFDAPEGALGPELLAELRARKDDLLALLRHGQAAAGHQQLRPQPHAGTVPLSPAQRGLWAVSGQAGGSVAYNVPYVTRLTGALDVAALARSLEEVVRRHESLRTTFHLEDDGPIQRIHPPAALDLPVDDLGDVPPGAREAELARRVDREVHQAFDLERGPLVRVRLIRLAAAEHVLCVVVHHIVGDGWSLAVLTREVNALYAAFVTGAASPLPPLPLQYADFGRWHAERLAGGAAERHLEHWRRTLADVPPLQLPTDRPRPHAAAFRGELLVHALDASLTEALRAAARCEGVSLHDVLFAAFQVVLARVSGQVDFAVASGTLGRRHPMLEPLIGHFFNIAMIRSDLADDPSFADLLARVRRDLLAAGEHEDLPFERVVEAVRPERVAGQNPLAQVALSLEKYSAGGLALPGVVATREALRFRAAKLDLALWISELDRGLEIAAEYNSDLFDGVTLATLIARYERLLRDVLGDRGRRISQLALLSEAERAALIAGAGASNTVSPRLRVDQQFAARARLAPDAPALVDLCGGGETWTYAALDRRADAIAARLRELGVRPGVLVGVCLERSADLVAALIGSMRSGGAFVVLDPELPAQRLAFMLADTAVTVLVSHAALQASLPASDARLVDLDVPLPHAAAIDGGAGPDDLAYALYTSGSTGTANGVLVEHAGLANAIAAHVELMATGPGTRHAHVLSFNFDGALAHLFVMICAGGTVYLAPRDGAFLADGLASLIDREAITHTCLPPTMLAALPDAPLPSLHTLVVAGERCSAALVDRWGRGRRMLNLYGPTEASILATAARCVADGEPPPIGRPIAGTRAYVLDRWGGLAVPGAAGELALAGVGVARGYLDRPELTARKFVTDPFVGGRMYRTGDLVRLRTRPGADAPSLEFLGRIDAQVKIRGHRIEPAEIEHALRGLAEVGDAVVTVFTAADDTAGRLVAYVSPRRADADTDGLAERLHSELCATLPAPLVPSTIVVLPALPFTLSGKVDLRALPRPDAEAAEPTEPRSEVERLLVGIWCAALGRERVGIHDNFFALGGDSVLGIQVVARAQERGIGLRAGQLFEHQTIAELAAAAGELGLAGEVDTHGPAPLTPIQRWFFAQDIPRDHFNHFNHFNQAILLEVPATLGPAQLAAALGHVQASHAALRLRFTRGADGWSQAVLGDTAVGPPPLEVIDLADLAELPTIAARLHAGLDITAGPIQRAAFIRLESSARVLWVIHHLAVDAVSWRILVPDLAAALRQLAADQPVSIPPATTSFKQWTTRLHALTAADAFTAERAALRAPSSRPLPVEHPHGADDRAASATVQVRLDAATTRSLLRDALRPYNLATQDILLTALVQAVARWTGEAALWVDLEGHGREDLFPDVDLSRTVGWFTALYPVRLALPADDDPADALVAIKDQLRAVPRRGVGFGLLRYLHPDGPELAWPAPVIAFNYVGQLGARSLEDPATGIRLAREDAGPGLPAHGRRAHEIEANGVVRGGVLEFGFTFSRARIDEATVTRLADDFITNVAALVRHCLSAVGAWSPGDFPLVSLTHKELRGLLARVGETGRARVAAVHPVTALQKGLLYHALQAETAGAYGTQVVLSLTGTLDPAAFRAAWQQLVRRHEALRSGFHWDGLSEPVQVVLLTAEVSLDEHDWRAVADLEARLERLYSELAARPLSLHDAPVMRVTLVRTAADRHVLIWDSYHILMDGWSMSVLLRDLHAAYRAARSGQALASPPPPPSYAAYLRWLARQDHAAATTAWRAAMHGFAGPTPLPGERTPPGAHALRQIDLRLPADLTAALGAATDAARVTMASALAGAWACVLARNAGQDDVLFGTVVSGRDAAVPGIESMLGLFIHMLPVRVHVDDDAEVWPWLRALQTRQAAARAHQTTPLAEIQSFTEVPAGTPLFRSVVVYQDYPFDAALFSDGELSVGFVRAADPTHYPLVVTAIPGPELHLSFEYDEAWLEPGAAERLAGQLEAALRGLIDAADARVSALTTLAPDERSRVLAELDNTGHDLAHDRGATIHGLFAAQAARTPDAPAVYHGERIVSYAALERRANRLARHLQRRGVGVETRVGVCMDRSDELIVALLAILKAGGAYVPIDPTYPLARQAFMAEDAGAALVLTGRGLAARFVADRSRLVNLDADADTIAREGDSGLAPGQPGRLAYIIYTSGSTGQPKGVAIEHRSAVAMLQAALAQYSEADLHVVSACASICFDYSILEIFLPLIVGGAVVLVDDALALPSAPARDRVRLLSLVPSAMTELHRAGSIPAGVRAINLAGERLGREVVDRAYGLPHVERVYNIYGPTETTTFSTYSRPARDSADEPTLGRPIAGTRIYLLDARMRPVPIGAPGELWIGGAGVARGYWNRPALTAERFVDDPFGPGRIYRTGDLGRLTANGEIAYLGRIDDQVKLRGFRVELGEIEAALARMPGVEQAVVVADGDPPQRLVAHWVAAPGAALAAGDLRARLAESLPAFMVPEIYVRRDELPRTASGKVDRRALPKPVESDVRQHAFTAPETPLEQALAQIWQEVLDVPRVGAEDNFFRLGGHSLLALTMVMRVEAELDRTISIATLFQAPTLRALARTLEVPDSEPTTGPAASPLLLPIQPHGARPPVFCVGGFGVHASYLHPLGPALGDDQPFYAIQPLDISAEHPELESMEALAEHLADVVQSVQPAGPYTLSGHSAGARLALAIGFVLEARGHRTATVVLDMHAPVPGGASQDKWSAGDDDLLGYIRQMKVVLGEALSVDIEATARMPDDQAWAHIAAILERERLLPPGGGVAMLRRTILLRRRVFTLLADHVPATPYPGRLVLLSVADRHRAGLPRISAAAWQTYCARPVEPFLVPGDHLTMVRPPHVAVVAAHLRRVVDETRLPVIDAVGAVTDPASAFTVKWDDPDDAAAMWLFDAAHCSAPMSRLDFELRMAPMTDGTNRANVLYGLPLSSEPRLINTFVFQKASAPDIAPGAADAVWQGADAAMRRGAEGLAARWTGTWLPEIQRHLAELHAVDLAAASLPGLVLHLAELRRRVVRLWEIHFELMYPLTLALSDFDDAYRDLFPDARPLEVYELLAGFPSKTTEANLRLWELGRVAARSPALRATIGGTDVHDLPAALAATPAGQQLWSELQDYMRMYGERSDDLYIDRPGWLEQPTPILRGLQEAVRQPDRDLAAELRGQTERREARLAAVRAALADHPRPVVAEFESLLAAAQASTHLGEEHNFWIDAKITFHARRAALEVGRRLAARGAIYDPEDVFQVAIAELEHAAADPGSTFRSTVAERRAEAARFAGTRPPKVLGVMRPFLPMDSALMRAMFRMNGDQLSPPAKDGSLSGMPGSGGKVTGPARVVRTLAEAGKLRPGDVLVATATLPSWTPYFAIASAVVTNTGGMLCHAAVVAREYGIPAVVGTRSATETLHDGQLVEVDGDAGTVRVVA